MPFIFAYIIYPLTLNFVDMLKSEKIKIQISNNGKYWNSLGYGPLKQRDVIEVNVSDLPFNSNKKVEFYCDDCGEVNERQFQLLSRQEVHRCYSCSRIHIGKTMDTSKAAASARERTGENHPRWRPNKAELINYGRRVHWLTRCNYKKYHHIINPENHVRGRCGVDGAWQLDHIKSIKFCFENNISPEDCAAVENLQMLSWEANRKKWS